MMWPMSSPAVARRSLARLGPIAQLRAGRLGRRLPQLLLGLWLYGVSLAMIVRAALGNAPWDVLHQGLAHHLPLTFGQVLIVVSVAVLLLWIPIREIPGLGTVLNTFLIGIAADWTLSFLDTPTSLWLRVTLLVGGVFLNGIATASYIGSQFGPGPRDGLMTGLHRRHGWSLFKVRTGLEITVVILGFLLGGTLGLGTLVYAFGIGPLTHWLLPIFTVDLGQD